MLRDLLQLLFIFFARFITEIHSIVSALGAHDDKQNSEMMLYNSITCKAGIKPQYFLGTNRNASVEKKSFMEKHVYIH